LLVRTLDDGGLPPDQANTISQQAPDNFIATGNALEKRGLTIRKSQDAIRRAQDAADKLARRTGAATAKLISMQ
jgi:hypothetical protein